MPNAPHCLTAAASAANLRDSAAIHEWNRGEFEEAVRAQMRATYIGNGEVLCNRVLGRYAMYVDGQDHEISPHLILSGFWEMWITQAIARCLKPGMVAVDVGANLGYYTLLMADLVGATGRVFAFEPNPRMASLLRRSVSINGYLPWVEIDPRPTAEASGLRVKFRIPPGNPGGASVVAAGASSSDVIELETVALDDILPEKVDVMKIDVEGAELRSWRGMARTLSRNRDIRIFLEFAAARYPSVADDFLREIEDSGFSLALAGYDGFPKPATREQIIAQTAASHVDLYLSRAS